MFDALTDFHFLRPWWLVAAVPFVAAYFALRKQSTRAGPFEESIAPHLRQHLVTGREGRARLTPLAMLLPFFVLASVAAAGPTWELADTPDAPDGSALILVVDLSSSMDGEDIGPSRIGRIRLKLRDLLDMRRDAPTGLIVVGGTSHVVMPLTDDVDALTPYIDVLAPDLMPTDGEAFAAAAPLIAELAGGVDVSTTALVISDSIPPEGATALASMAQETGVTLGLWAVGTDAGRPAENLPGLDLTGMERLTRDADAELIELSLGGGDLRAVRQLLERTRRASVDAGDAHLWEDAGYGLVPLLAIIVCLWFRRGWVLPSASGTAALWLLLLPLASLSAGCTDARVMGVFMTPDQQGRYLLERGDYEEAAERFENPMWEGTARYAAHDWAGAQAAYARVDSPEGLYNLGNAHAQAGEIVSAIAAYDRALRERPTFTEARSNRDLFQEMLEGLTASTDREELAHPAEGDADPEAVRLREDQRLDDDERSPASLADQERGPPADVAMNAELADQWMARVSTTPAEFLKTKFALQAARQR